MAASLHILLFLSSFACIAGLRVVHSETSKHSVPKTILVAQLDYDYIESGLFRNWFKHAAKFFPSGSVELVLDTDGNTTVDKYLKDFDFGNIPYKTLAEKMPAELTISAAQKVHTDPWGSKSYKKLMTHRPQAIKKLLEDGNVVFQFDVDTVWVNNPFSKFDAAGNHDMLVTADGSTSNVCGCLLFIRPSVKTVELMADWIGAINKNDEGNQQGLNRILAKNKKHKKYDVSFLEVGDFPPGSLANKFPNATVFHANFLKGIPKKVEFFKTRNLWIEE